MTQRQVKPYYWPVHIAGCAAFSVMLFFLIAGMIRSHTVAFSIGPINVPGEDYFIAVVVGCVLFLAARAVRNNAFEKSAAAMGLIFGALVIAAVATWGMHYQLTAGARVDFAQFYGHRLALLDQLGHLHTTRGIGYLSDYREWFNTLHVVEQFPLSHGAVQMVQRAIHLSYGIIAGIVFIVLQTAALFLLFYKTKPPARELRH